MSAYKFSHGLNWAANPGFALRAIVVIAVLQTEIGVFATLRYKAAYNKINLFCAEL